MARAFYHYKFGIKAFCLLYLHLIEGITRSGTRYLRELPLNNSSDSDSTFNWDSSEATMSDSGSNGRNPDFVQQVQDQVERTIAAMIAAGTLVAPAASSRSVTYVTDPFKGDFNPADKYGASLFKTATEPLPEKDRFL